MRTKKALRQIFASKAPNWRCAAGRSAWSCRRWMAPRSKPLAAVTAAGARSIWKNFWPPWTPRWTRPELALAQENNEPVGYRLPAGLAERQALREQVKAGLAQLAADGRNHYHPDEPEARRMKVGGVNRFAYNAQAVVDSQEE